MVEGKYCPTLVEFNELVLLWNRSISLSTSLTTRLAWVTKSFVNNHPDVTHRVLYAWLERNLEISKGFERPPAMPWHEEVTAVYRIPRSKSND